MKTKRNITKTTKTEVVITADDIRKAFDLPASAVVFVQVPGGGDWSNMTLVLDRETKLEASYTTEETL